MNQAPRSKGKLRRTSGIMAIAESGEGATLTDQLFQSIRRLIADGVWRRGERIPGSRVLAEDAKVSRTTVLATLEMLVAEGLLETRGTAGTYVAASASAQPAAISPAQAPAPHAAPFSVGAPGLDLFPLHVWRRLQTRRWSTMPLSALDDGDEAGEFELRTAIAAHVDASRGIKCNPSQVVIVSSALSAIHVATLVLADRGAEVWTEEPGYFRAFTGMRAAGVTPVPVPVDNEGLIVEQGRVRAPQAKVAVVTPACQFPLGVTMSLERRHALINWAAKEGAWIVEDDYDSEFPVAKRVLRPLAALSAAPRVIYINTFSKTLFPSLRLAYLIVPESLIDRFIAARRGIDRNATVPNQMVLADFLSTGQFARHLRQCREAYAERRAVMLEGLTREFAGALCAHEHRPGLHICATYDAEVDDGDLASRAAKAGIVVEPLKRFFTGPQTQRGLLLGYAGFTPAVIRAQLNTLARAIGPALR